MEAKATAKAKGSRIKGDNLMVLSLDYDGCCFVLDDSNAVSGIGHMLSSYRKYIVDNIHDSVKSESMNKNINTFVKHASKKIKEKLEEYLSTYSYSSDDVSLYVGSLRQSIIQDQHNSRQNKNGSCFEAYQRYSQAKGWSFNHLLSADITNKLPPGTAMVNKMYDCNVDELKVSIIKHQLEDVIRNHGSEKKIKFVFIDDDIDNIIIKSLEEHFVLKPDELPSNIELTLVKFDWYKAINQSMLWDYVCGNSGYDTLTLIEDLSVSLDESFNENKKVLNAKAEGVNTAMPTSAPSVEKSEKDPGQESDIDSSGGGCGGSASAFAFCPNQRGGKRPNLPGGRSYATPGR